MAAVTLLSVGAAYAQSDPMMAPLEDNSVRTGKLENGLTYYIRHNEYPKGQANFHIAQKVGAVQEEENQNGLAHFLEHMCFNGTKNFPGNKIVTWLETKGVKFGVNLNAYTSTDLTVYEVKNVPVTNTEVVDSCLLILHDWSNALTLADAEIEKERGVIHEEWRLGNGAISRILNRQAPTLYPGTKYATHNVIGTMEVVDNFPPQLLRDYYHKWYRPDLQGIIVVGDIDVDRTEQKIKEMFGPIKMPANPGKFDYQVVADNDEPIVISDKEKEMPANLLLVAQKFDLLPREMRNTNTGLIFDYMQSMFDIMMNQRLTEIAMSNDAPFSSCSGGFGKYLYASTKGAITLQGIVNEKGTDTALRAILTELKRVKEYGFTAAEYDRARTEYLSSLEKSFSNFAQEKNGTFAEIYIQHFIENNPIVAVDYEYEFLRQVTPMLPVEQLNAFLKEILTDKNLVVMSLCPDKEGVKVPTVDELKAVINEVKAAPVEAYVDTTVNEPLIATAPKAGSVVSTTTNDALGYTELVLSNGAKVILKKTNYKDDEILFNAQSEGGASLYGAEDFANYTLAADMVEMMGLSKFSYTDLQKMLSGKQVSLSASINNYSEAMSGSTSVKDLETLMQLIYLKFTQPREDEATFNNVKSMVLGQMENMAHDPQFIYQDSLTRKLYGHHPKALVLDKDAVAKADYNRILTIYKERFANAADFTFFFVGSFDMDQMTEFAKTYIGSLPASSAREKAVNDGKEMVKGIVREEFRMKSESNLSKMAMIWNVDMPYTMENSVLASITGQLMSNELLTRVREDDGAAYSPYAMGAATSSYKDFVTVQTIFELNPDKSATSEKTTIDCLESLARDVKDEELAKMQEFMLKKFEENIVENGYWMNTLVNYVTEGIDGYTNYKAFVSGLTEKQIESFVGKIIKANNRFELLLLPE